MAAPAGDRQQEARQPVAHLVLEHHAALCRPAAVKLQAKPDLPARRPFAHVRFARQAPAGHGGPSQGPRGPFRLAGPGSVRPGRHAHRGPDGGMDGPMAESRHDPHPGPEVRHARAAGVRRKPLVHPLACSASSTALWAGSTGPARKSTARSRSSGTSSTACPAASPRENSRVRQLTSHAAYLETYF